MKVKIAPKTTVSGLLKLMLMLLALCLSGYVSTASIAEGEPKIVPALSAVASGLHASKAPVFLPSYLPTWNYKLYGSAELGEFEYGQGYEATVATEPGTPCNANTLFYLSGGQGPVVPPKGSNQVDLGEGRIGYYFGGGNFHTLDWSIGKNAYRIASYQPQSELVKIAKSMVAVK